ncbi:MAG TPA: class I SAM-dependent methyltransferase [Symbiobacteriaceae bacterium]|nr:class I SAM-dependent methyltransferase [Symbiobacteriaceae bacterium]
MTGATAATAEFEEYVSAARMRDINSGLRFLDIYCTRVICRLFATLGLYQKPGEALSVEQAIAAGGLHAPATAVPLAFMCMWLASRGFLQKTECDGVLSYTPERALPVPDLDELDRHPIAQRCWAACRLIRRVVDVSPPIFRGEGSDLQLYAPETISDWEGYFAHPAMQVPALFNALYIYRELQRFDRPVRIMELGAGSAVASRILYEFLRAKGELHRVEAFHITDLAEPFVDSSRKAVEAAFGPRPEFTFYKFDMNGELADQGLEPGTMDIIFGMNSMHYMSDWRTQFPILRDLLRPGGFLSIVGVLRKQVELPIHIELAGAPFAAYWDLATIPDIRPGFGIMPPQETAIGLARYGFDETEIWPNPEIWAKEIPMDFFYGVVVGKRG